MARLSVEHYRDKDPMTPENARRSTRLRDIFKSRPSTTPDGKSVHESSPVTMGSLTSLTAKPGFEKVGMYPNERTNDPRDIAEKEKSQQTKLSQISETQDMGVGQSVQDLGSIFNTIDKKLASRADDERIASASSEPLSLPELSDNNRFAAKSEIDGSGCQSSKISQETRDFITSEITKALSHRIVEEAPEDTNALKTPTNTLQITLYGFDKTKSQVRNHSDLAGLKLLEGDRTIGPYLMSASNLSLGAQLAVAVIYMAFLLISALSGPVMLFKLVTSGAILSGSYLIAGGFFGWNIDMETDLILSPINLSVLYAKIKVLQLLGESVKVVLEILFDEPLDIMAKRGAVIVDQVKNP